MNLSSRTSTIGLALVQFLGSRVRSSAAVYDPSGEIVTKPDDPLDDKHRALRGEGSESGNAPENPSNGNGGGERTTFIVTFADDDGDREEKANGLAKSMGGEVGSCFKTVLNGFVMTLPNEASIAALERNPLVETVEEDQTVYALSEWGQDRISQCAANPLDGTKFSRIDAPDVEIHVIDTGVLATHEDFLDVVNATDECHATFNNGDGTKTPYVADDNGHGTHVASTAGGMTYGVAKPGKICAIRVLDAEGSGSWADVIAGIDMVATNCAGKKCVINISLGGLKYDPVNSAIKSATDAGLVVIVAAGNGDADACDFSPASEPSAITVGATARAGWGDVPVGFTNYGKCVDVVAPGVGIKAAWHTSDSATETIDGTSMASPHVAGLAAYHLQQGVAAANVPSVISHPANVSVINVDCRNFEAGVAVGIATVGNLGCDDAKLDCASPCDDSGNRCFSNGDCCGGAQFCAKFFPFWWWPGRCSE